MIETFLGGLLCPKVNKPTKAVWHIKSSNKYWNDRGPFIYKGMRGIPIECSTRIEELKLRYGSPPEDLEWGFTLGAWRYYWALFVSLFNYRSKFRSK